MKIETIVEEFVEEKTAQLTSCFSDFEPKDVLSLGVSIVKECQRQMKRPISLSEAQEAIDYGVKSWVESKKTVSFLRAVEETLKVKQARRPSTLQEIRYVTSKLSIQQDGLSGRLVCDISPEEWQEMIELVFTTSRQRYKARLIIHGVYALAQKRGWCSSNPLSRMDVPLLKEKEIPILRLHEVRELLEVAQKELKSECLPAIALMLYAGIRPYEVKRLTWQNIRWQEGVILLKGTQTKTGGGRLVTMEAVLVALLKEYGQAHPLLLEKNAPLVPKNWTQKWAFIREKAGWKPALAHSKCLRRLLKVDSFSTWEKNENQAKEGGFSVARIWHQDMLRHTYASYHALHYKDFTRLQYEMGHRSSALLRSRYVNLNAISTQEAAQFFKSAFF